MGHNNGTTNGTVVGSLDLSKPSDRVLVAKSRRWATDPEFREQCVKALRAALSISLKQASDGNTGAVRDINATIRNAALMEAQNQADEHVEEKNNRIDGGQGTECIQVVYANESIAEFHR